MKINSIFILATMSIYLIKKFFLLHEGVYLNYFPDDILQLSAQALIQSMNDPDHNSSIDDIESQESVNLVQLRRNVTLSNLQLLQLTYNDEKFIECIDNFNQNGIDRISNEQLKQALVYFSENQKILQYAASCGKTIDRSIIIATLHNQACIHQKLWDLEKSANYLQAIIYNINIYLQGQADKKTEYRVQKPKNKQQLETQAALAHKKENYALYQLQFCAVNSQIRKHNVSLESAYTTIKILKEVCKDTEILIAQLENPMNLSNRQFADNKKILHQLTSLDEKLSVNQYQFLMKKVRALMSDKIQRSVPLEQDYGYLKSFSIGKLMQLTPIKISEIQYKPSMQEWIQYDNILLKALYLAVAYFTVGTQLRFISSMSCQEGSEQYKNSVEFKTSQIYHLYAILIILTYVPLDTIFLNHLITSFNNHYLIDIEKYNTNTIHLSGSDKLSVEFKTGNQVLSSEQPVVNQLPQSSELKISHNENISQKSLKKQKSVKTQNNEPGHEKTHHTKTTRIKNIEHITFIKKTQQFRKEEIYDKSHHKNKKNSNHSSRKNRVQFLSTHQDSTDPTIKSKGKTFKDVNTTEQPKTNKKMKTLMPMRTSSSKMKKNKSSSNSQSKTHKTKGKCIYTTRNKLDIHPEEEPHRKDKKNQISKSKSRSKKKSLKPHGKLMYSQQQDFDYLKNKSHVQRYQNDLINSPKSEDFDDIFRDRAKLTQSKVGDEVLIRNAGIEMHRDDKIKGRSKGKQKQKIKMKKVVTKTKKY